MENFPDLNTPELASPKPASYLNEIGIEKRLLDRSWETRAGAFEELSSSINKAVLFQLVENSPSVFLEEITVRGQEASLKCLIHWAKGSVSFGPNPEYSFIKSLIRRYSVVNQDKLRSLLMEILYICAERFGTNKIASVLHKAIDECCRELVSPRPKDPASKADSKGLLSRQAAGCIQILSSMTEKQGDVTLMRPSVTRVSEMLGKSGGDRNLREECYSFLCFVFKNNQDFSIQSLNLPDAQANELRSRLVSPSNIDIDVKPMNVQETRVEESMSTCAASPRPVSDVKPLLAILEKSAKWSERRDAWIKLRTCVDSIDEQVFNVVTRTLKQDINVPITVEACNFVSAHLGTLTSQAQRRHLLSVLTTRMKDKSSPVKKVVSDVIVALLKHSPAIADPRWIELDLKPVSTVATSDIINLIDLVLPSLIGGEVKVLEAVVVPAIARSMEGPVRDACILVAKKIIAQTAHSGSVHDAIRVIKHGLASLSRPRQEVLERALGFALTADKRRTPVPRPVSAPASTVRSSGIVFRNRSSGSGTDGKWFPYIVHTDSLAMKFIGQLRSVFVASKESESLRELMASSRPMEILKAGRSWLSIVSTNTDGWRETIELVFKWIGLTVTVHRDNISVWKSFIELISTILQGAGRDLSRYESTLIVPLLADRLANPLLREKLRSLLLVEVSKVSPDYHSLLRQYISKSRNTKAATECEDLLRRVPVTNTAVSELKEALTAGEAANVVEACHRLESMPAGQDESIVEILSGVLPVVLSSTNSEIRQAVLPLLHQLCRKTSVWNRLSLPPLKAFIGQLLTVVADKNLRHTEPELWAELNLSLVHAIANSQRPTAYTALLALSREGELTKPLIARCIDKINRSLSTESDSRLEPLLKALQNHIHDLLVHNQDEAAIVADECVITCLRGLCAVIDPIEVGEFVGLHVRSPAERLLWKKILKTYSATERLRNQ